MYPTQCDYHRASSTQEAIELLGQHPEAKVLAGGHSLIPLMKLRLANPTALVDIGRIEELKGISKADGIVSIGALTTHAELAASDLLASDCRLLAEAAAGIADPQVRNKGTLGGNIAHADPASDLPAVLVALGAEVELADPEGTRRVAAGDFFLGLLTSDVRHGELLTRIEVPAAGSGTGSAYLKVEHPASGYAVCGAAAVVTMEGGNCKAASLALNGVAATPVDADAVAAALVGTSADEGAIATAVDDHLTISEPLGDLHASGEYRVQLALTYGKRALEIARDRAGG
jgi:carbon-monoxide dehydrogenase medium subunit